MPPEVKRAMLSLASSQPHKDIEAALRVIREGGPKAYGEFKFVAINDENNCPVSLARRQGAQKPIRTACVVSAIQPDPDAHLEVLSELNKRKRTISSEYL